ncbi:hypothetical protein H4S02_010561, partial [Coemansia sp. RSA 2611]
MTVEPVLDLAPVWILEQVDEEDAACGTSSGADNPQAGSSDRSDHLDRLNRQRNRQIINEEREDIWTWLGTANPAIAGPDSYRAAMRFAEAPKWKEAVMAELESIDNND